MSTLRDKLNGMIVNQNEIKSYFAERSEEITKIKSPTAYVDEIKEYFAGDFHKGLLLPWIKTHDDFRIRPAEVSIWAGYSGAGKSLFTSQVMLGLMKTEKVMLASFELRPVSSCQRAIRQTLGAERPTENYIESWVNKADQKLFLYDQQGVVTPETVLEVVYYSAEKLKCSQIILDSFMKCGIDEQDYQQHKKFIDQLCIAARDLKIHIHLVAHARKRSDDLMKPPTKHDVSGSANITNLVDNCFIVYRTNKDKKYEELQSGDITQEEYDNIPSTMVYCVKQRHYEWEGKWSFWFDPDSLSFSETKNLDKRLKYI